MALIYGTVEWLNSNIGTIGTLIIAGDSTGIDWGIVNNLKFHENGEGVVTITATANSITPAAFPLFQAANGTMNPNISFTGIQAKNVNLKYGTVEIILDEGLILADLASFSLADLFGATEVVGVAELDTLNITVAGTTASVIIDGVVVHDDFVVKNGELLYDPNGGNGGGGEVIPVSATFADLIWSDENLFGDDWMDFSEQSTEADLWSEIFEDNMLMSLT